MTKRVLITGGAGFIGSHLSDELLARGYRVRAPDSWCRRFTGRTAGDRGTSRPRWSSSGAMSATVQRWSGR